jgi:hypothetical protein
VGDRSGVFLNTAISLMAIALEFDVVDDPHFVLAEI